MPGSLRPGTFTQLSGAPGRRCSPMRVRTALLPDWHAWLQTRNPRQGTSYTRLASVGKMRWRHTVAPCSLGLQVQWLELSVMRIAGLPHTWLWGVSVQRG